MLNETQTLDWWLHQLYRQIKDFVAHPTKSKEDKLLSLVTEYRQRFEQRSHDRVLDEHEQAMNFR